MGSWMARARVRISAGVGVLVMGRVSFSLGGWLRPSWKLRSFQEGLVPSLVRIGVGFAWSGDHSLAAPLAGYPN